MTVYSLNSAQLLASDLQFYPGASTEHVNMVHPVSLSVEEKTSRLLLVVDREPEVALCTFADVC